MNIRKETTSDIASIYKIHKQAFQQKDEAELVDELRQTSTFIPELSLVCEDDGKIIGHILFSRIAIHGEKQYNSLSLAPMAVLPLLQNQGIGSLLVRHGLRVAKTMGFGSVVVLGHPGYYPRFGFKKASKWGLQFPCEVPEEAFMAIELKEGALKGKAGMVSYPEPFGI